MRISPTLYLLAAAMSCATTCNAQQSFVLSSKFVEGRFSGQQFWPGDHRFGNVFCLTFPRASEAEAMAVALYNNNTLYFSRAAYKNLTALYVVTSVVPAGRSVDVEIGNLAAQNRKFIESYPRNVTQTQTNSAFGPSLTLTVRNAKEGGKDAPFPFVRSLDPRSDAPLTSLSVHRLFVHGRDRIEVAGLRYFKTPIAEDQEAGTVSDLTALVEEAAVSLQSCTSKLPASSQDGK